MIKKQLPPPEAAAGQVGVCHAFRSFRGWRSSVGGKVSSRGKFHSEEMRCFFISMPSIAKRRRVSDNATHVSADL